MAADTAHVRRLSRRLVEGIRAQLEHVVFNGDEANTYDGCVNLSFAYVEVSLSILIPEHPHCVDENQTAFIVQNYWVAHRLVG